jgi:hypothetical protein
MSDQTLAHRNPPIAHAHHRRGAALRLGQFPGHRSARISPTQFLHRVGQTALDPNPWGRRRRRRPGRQEQFAQPADGAAGRHDPGGRGRRGGECECRSRVGGRRRRTAREQKSLAALQPGLHAPPEPGHVPQRSPEACPADGQRGGGNARRKWWQCGGGWQIRWCGNARSWPRAGQPNWPIIAEEVFHAVWERKRRHFPICRPNVGPRPSQPREEEATAAGTSEAGDPSTPSQSSLAFGGSTEDRPRGKQTNQSINSLSLPFTTSIPLPLTNSSGLFLHSPSQQQRFPDDQRGGHGGRILHNIHKTFDLMPISNIFIS